MRLPLNSRLNGRLGKNWTFSCLALIVLVTTATGCKNGFIDPGEMGRYQKSLPIPILRVLDAGIDEPDPKWRNVSMVTAADMEPTQGDYVLGRNDYVAILITDLVAPNVESVVQKRISESGKISLPLIGQIQAAGLTEAQLESAINQGYKDAGLIQNATVSVSVLEARNRTYTISGAVGNPGEYQILSSDFRLLNALNYARNVTSTGIDYIYIIRKQQPGTGAGGAGTGPATRPNTDVLMPRGAANHNTEGAVAQGSTGSRRVSMLTQPADVPAATEPTTQPGDEEGRVITIEGRPVTTDQPGVTDTTPTATPGMDQSTEAPVQPVTPTDYRAAGTFQFEPPPEPTDVRVIRVPLDALITHGDLRYNLVIRPGDMIIVPNPIIGEYYMGGHVARVGVYSLTARKITLKMAVISAGMLDQVAIPQRTQIVRRLEGQDREFYAVVDLAKIFAGEAPDVYLKPDDQVMVGTNFVAPFIAAVRNGFRITYGFGFLYDRNYYNDQNQ
ncbi:MAG: polysaccharide biosynthesis/export family protein [Anaerolineae bacterium]|nr:polysaccharide biosynthesis/export family protein [Phycisphaerae bacterium]